MAASLFLARSAQAQQGEGTLTGTITDAATKKPVADVVVTATSPNLQGEQIVVTDASGFYRIPSLPPGVYTLRFDKEAFKPLAREGIELRSETTMRLNVELLPEALQAEEVVVVARNPTVDVGSSSTGANLNAEFTRRIPVSAPGGKGSASRSFESVAEAAAGANSDDFGTTINGASSAENSYIIDGLSTNNPGFGISGTPLSSEFVGEINVITGGYLPEYGRSTGGVLSVITKSGTNEFHGGAYLNYSPGALEGSRHAVPREGASVLFQQKLRYEGDIGADIGGPIIKDKLWFYGGLNVSKTAYDIRRSVNRIHIDPTTNMPAMDSNGFTLTDEVPGNTTHYDAQLQTIQALGKLTYALNPSHRFTLTFMTLPASSGGTNQFGIDPRSGQPEVDTGSNGGTVQSLGHRFATTPYDATLRWTAESPKKNVTVESLVGWHRQSESLLPSDGSQIGSKLASDLSSQPTIQWTQPGHNVSDLDPALRNSAMCQDTVTDPITHLPTIRNLCPVSPQYNSNGPGQLDKQTYDRYQVSSTLTYLFPWLGHHIAKVGFSLELTDYAHTKSYSGGVQYLENDDGTIGDQFRFGYLSAPDVPVSLDGRTLHTKSFIGGGFVQDSWSIVDKFTLNLGVRYDTQALYSDGGQRGLVLPNQWSPRLGAIYDPTQSGRAKIFVNYAKYYENVPLDLADVALSGEPHTLAVYDSPCSPAQVVKDPKGCLNTPVPQNGATNPNQKFVAFGSGASPIDPDLKPQSQHEVVAGADYEVLTDARVSLTYTKRWMGDVVEDMSRDGLQTFFLGNPGEGVASDFPKARRDYDAVTLQFVKNFRNNWLGQASYTWSHLRGNIGGLISQDGALIPNHTPDFDTKSLTINRDGDLPNDHRHSLKVFGAKEWVVAARSHISTGLALRATSGAPSTALGKDENYGLGFAFLEPRGTGPRLPWTYSADIRGGYTFFINKNQALSLTVDVFNFLNLQQPTSIEENYTTNTVTLPPKGGKLADAVYADGPDAGKPVKQDVLNYGNATSYSSPRTFRFGARWTF
ncbi:MAG TPA: TonB-dependent receptor [Polyangia bacterium]|nr:TonB-dependent receptor [Polyangia bacterium]